MRSHHQRPVRQQERVHLHRRRSGGRTGSPTCSPSCGASRQVVCTICTRGTATSAVHLSQRTQPRPLSLRSLSVASHSQYCTIGVQTSVPGAGDRWHFLLLHRTAVHSTGVPASHPSARHSCRSDHVALCGCSTASSGVRRRAVRLKCAGRERSGVRQPWAALLVAAVCTHHPCLDVWQLDYSVYGHAFISWL